MYYANADEFLAASHKRITLMGMSNVGKTHLSSMLRLGDWFHYSVDYRIGTFHLREAIIDELKRHMMRDPFLATHLRSDAMNIDLCVGFNNLTMVSQFLGQPGSEALGGLSFSEFQRRQNKHHAAEIAAMMDLPAFIDRGKNLYCYNNLICDSSGSLCEVIDVDNPDDPVLGTVLGESLLVYIEADEAHEAELVRQARLHPKPLYFHPAFLQSCMDEVLAQCGTTRVEDLVPGQFAAAAFPKLLEWRRPRYRKLAKMGCTVPASAVGQVRCEEDFFDVVADAMERDRRNFPDDVCLEGESSTAISGAPPM